MRAPDLDPASQLILRWRQIGGYTICAFAVLLFWEVGLSAADHASAEPIVQLPPFIVEQSFRGPAWRYGEIPGFEILSRCSDTTTADLVLALQNAHRLLRIILPEHFQVRIDAQQALIFYDEELWPVAEREAIAAIVRSGFSVSQPARETPFRQTRHAESAIGERTLNARSMAIDRPVSFFGNMRLADADVTTTFAIVSRAGLDPHNAILTARYVGQTLGSRVPSLPSWFTAGFLSAYGQMKFRQHSVALGRIEWPTPISSSAAANTLIPLQEFFADESLSGARDPIRWLAQAELFVR